MNAIPMPVIAPTASGDYIVAADWEIAFTTSEGRSYRLVIREGFTFNGASIPRFLWRLCGQPMEAPRVVAALGHDWLYASQLLSRSEADEIYYSLCLAVDVAKFRAKVEWAALRTCGWAAWRAVSNTERIRAQALGSITALTTTPKTTPQ